MRRVTPVLVATVLIAGCGEAAAPASRSLSESPALSAIPSPSPGAQITGVITPTLSQPEARVTNWGVEGAVVVVSKVVDGDTIEVEADGTTETVQLIGVDAPEAGDGATPAECYGLEATDVTTRSLIGITVRLEFGDVERDDSGRLLAYVFLEERLFNTLIIRKGFAVASTEGSNVKYADRFAEAQERARADGAGLWGACGASPEPTETTGASAGAGP